MDIYAELPKEIRLKIYYYALPKMSERLKRAINVTSSHQCFQRIHKIISNQEHRILQLQELPLLKTQ